MIPPVLQTLPNEGISAVTYTPEFCVLCSVEGALITGTIEITYEPAQHLLEVVCFEKWLATLTSERATVERLCRIVFDVLTAALGDIPLLVEVRGRSTVHAPLCAKIERR